MVSFSCFCTITLHSATQLLKTTYNYWGLLCIFIVHSRFFFIYIALLFERLLWFVSISMTIPNKCVCAYSERRNAIEKYAHNWMFTYILVSKRQPKNPISHLLLRSKGNLITLLLSLFVSPIRQAEAQKFLFYYTFINNVSLSLYVACG